MSKTKRPTSVMILGTKFRIEYPEIIQDESEQVCGSMTGDERLIKISLKENPTELQLHSSLVHEIVHACLYVSGLSQVLDDKLEEAVVVALEHGIGPIFRRNF